jgi:choice-of-anchor B domain-containing protein
VRNPHRRNLAALGATAGLVAALAVTPALAHHPDGGDEAGHGKYEGFELKLERDWEVASSPSNDRAAERSNAPRTFAPCVRGMAADFFPCDGIDLLSHVSHAELGTTFVNDIWGWTDPQTRKDYALVGASNGTVFVDISDPKRPVVLGRLPSASDVGNPLWRDIKVFADHAYVVSEHSDHGVQVFDLTRLREWDGSYTIYDMDAHYLGHGSAHNIAINEDTGYAYSVGAGPYSAAGLPNLVTVDAPSPAAGTYEATGAAFGPAPTDTAITGSFAVVDDGSALPAEGCGPLLGFPAGAIAIADRGTCPFAQKAANAQAAGAVALVVANNQAGAPITMGGAGDVSIPAVMVSQADGNAIKAGLPATGGVSRNPDGPPCGDGLHMIDINDPKEPTYAGCFQEHGYVHDTQCVVYEGPDRRYHGREICFNSIGIDYTTDPAFNFVSIVDVTDKDDPVSLALETYAGSGYSHQGWLTPDQRYFLHGDEGDEVLTGVGTTTRVWDVSDLENPHIIQVFENETASIDHNIYTQGRYAYASNYTSGLRVYDTRDLAGEGLREVAYFDVYPENDNATFEGGTWSNYPYFRQKGVVAVSSIDRGLFILRPRVDRAGN